MTNSSCTDDAASCDDEEISKKKKGEILMSSSTARRKKARQKESLQQDHKLGVNTGNESLGGYGGGKVYLCRYNRSHRPGPAVPSHSASVASGTCKHPVLTHKLN